jgi:hypothetical protein
MRKWTRERIVREILARHSEGLGITCVGGKNGSAPTLYQAACRIFGSWKNAVAAAGLPTSEAKASQDWSPKKIIAAIRSLARRRSPLSAPEVHLRYGQLVPTARRYFGSWSKALYAARIDPRKLRRAKSWTKEQVIESILLKVIRSEPLVRKLVEPQSLAEAGSRLFGSWQSALEAAGLDFTKIEEIGNPPIVETAAELRTMSEDELSSFHHRRGTEWSEKEILAAVILRSRKGAAITGSAVDREQRGLYRAAIGRYGKWKKVLAITGLTAPTKS